VQALCGRGMRAVGRVVAQALARAWPIPADTLDFSGSASVSGVADDQDCDEGGRAGGCAARLDGEWTGDFFFRLERGLPGTWEATRPE